MSPTGDAVFFHSNLLHMSAVNSSTRRRLAFLIAYNKASNNPVKKHHHPQYTPLKKVFHLTFKHWRQNYFLKLEVCKNAKNFQTFLGLLGWFALSKQIIRLIFLYFMIEVISSGNTQWFHMYNSLAFSSVYVHKTIPLDIARRLSTKLCFT